MKCLGIESTAHTFGVGIVDENGEIHANIKDMYEPPKGWGIDPTKAKEHHLNKADEIIERAIEKGGEPDIVSVANGPGLPPCLSVGVEKAKDIARKYDAKLVPVNHCIGHIELGRLLTDAEDPIILYLSGGNTQVIAFEDGRYRVFGETEDISLGNLIDSFAREANLESPGGPSVEERAKKGEKYIEIPYVVKGMDVSFSGISTHLKNLIDEEKLEDLCYSLQENCFAMVVEVSERAMSHTEKDELLLTGGVAANQRLSNMCEKMCEERDASFFKVPPRLAGDNGVMSAWLGILSKDKGTKKYNEIDIRPNWRTDQVKVSWR